jgi:hypothetical protein
MLEGELQSNRQKQAKAHQTPSIASTAEQIDQKPGLLELTSVGLTSTLTGD